MLRSVQSFARNVIGVTRHFSAIKSTKSKSEKQQPTQKQPQDEIGTEEQLNAFFLKRTFGSNYSTWYKVLNKHPELKTLKRKDVTYTIETLKQLNFDIEDILSKPMVIYYNSLTLVNRYNIFKECGFEFINIPMLAKYVTIMNKTIVLLKSNKYISYDTDVSKCLKSCFTDTLFELPEDVCKQYEHLSLKALRQIVLTLYLKQRLDMNDNDINKMWKVYSRVKHKSFKSVQAIIDLLLTELKFSKERIKKNIYLAHADSENVQRILTEIPKIDNQDIREIVYKRPKIIMSPCDSLKKTLNYVRAFGIGEDAVVRCLEVLTLGPSTVLERLRDINEIEEFKVLGTNPRILRLVHYQNKARLRLDYLNQLKVRCASLHILSCGSETFAKFARDGSDRTKGRDIVVYLNNVMNKGENLRSLLSRHPNWCHIPVLQVKQCLEYLLSKKFTTDDILRNIHLLLYPIKRIEEKLLLLQTQEFLKDLHINVTSMHDLSNSEILTLILYLIESEFHFTGDGIWTEQHTYHVENFNNILPDFPESINKVYKYGVKPTEKVIMSQL